MVYPFVCTIYLDVPIYIGCNYLMSSSLFFYDWKQASFHITRNGRKTTLLQKGMLHVLKMCFNVLFLYGHSCLEEGMPVLERQLQLMNERFLVGGFEHCPYVGNNHPKWLIFHRGWNHQSGLFVNLTFFQDNIMSDRWLPHSMHGWLNVCSCFKMVWLPSLQ